MHAAAGLAERRTASVHNLCFGMKEEECMGRHKSVHAWPGFTLHLVFGEEGALGAVLPGCIQISLPCLCQHFDLCTSLALPPPLRPLFTCWQLYGAGSGGLCGDDAQRQSVRLQPHAWRAVRRARRRRPGVRTCPHSKRHALFLCTLEAETALLPLAAALQVNRWSCTCAILLVCQTPAQPSRSYVSMQRSAAFVILDLSCSACRSWRAWTRGCSA